MPKITISYRRADSEAMTGRIFDRLIAQYGRDAIFRDIDNIPAGIDFRQHINETLLKTGVLLAIVGPKWLGSSRGGVERINEESDPVRVEVETALRRRLPVIPVLIGNTRMPGSDQLPPSLKDFAFRNAVKIDTGRDFDHHMDQLFKSIDAILSETAKSSPPSRETKIADSAAPPAVKIGALPAAARSNQPRQTGSHPEPAIAPAARAVSLSNKTAIPERPIVIREWDQVIWPKNPTGRKLRLAGLAIVGLALAATLAAALWPSGAEVDSVHSLLALQNSAPVSALTFSPDSKTLAAASRDKLVNLWDVGVGKLSGRIPSPAGASSLVFMPNGEQIASGEMNGVVLVTQTASARTIRTFKPDVDYSWENAPAVQSIAVSPDGAQIASGYGEGTIKIWSVVGETVRPIKAHDGAVTALAYLPDGGKLVSASADGAVRIWNAATGQRLVSLGGHPGPILALAVSHDGKWLAAGGSGATVFVWNIAGGVVAHRLTARFGEVESLAFSKAGGRLAVGGNDATIEWWNVSTGQRLAAVTGHVRNVVTLAFSPDGSRFASGGDGTTIDIWSAD